MSVTVPPGVVTPDESARDSDCAKAVAPDMKNAIKTVAYFRVREHIVVKWYLPVCNRSTLSLDRRG